MARILNVSRVELDTKPHHVEMWYDRSTRCWITQLMNAAGDQLGDAYYCHAKQDAARMKAEWKADIKKQG